ncbi:MAG: uncharacterized membrane protein YgdD (TMEM256/DUF423 family) [Pseudohongiellaceae bacterium]|jgi:uncharacterized membrane protein YgdD (TMEM256/DUF423 family)|tara:strand:- start:731 stop:1144 length:414 start_codon:yes stop_codon:yes gene_type:complete
MNLVLRVTAVNGFLVVLLGAFGAHGLENMLSPERLETWNSGVQYHMFHTLALFGVGLLCLNYPGNTLLVRCAKFFLAGIVIFSGSLYLLAISGVSALGMITPIGGVAFLAGWTCLFIALLKRGEPSIQEIKHKKGDQ